MNSTTKKERLKKYQELLTLKEQTIMTQSLKKSEDIDINYKDKEDSYTVISVKEDIDCLQQGLNSLTSTAVEKTAGYIYNLSTLQLMLAYNNKRYHLPLIFKFIWEERDINSPLYKEYAVEAIAPDTKWEYIKVYLDYTQTAAFKKKKGKYNPDFLPQNSSMVEKQKRSKAKKLNKKKG